MTQTYKVTVEDNGNVFWKNESGELHRDGGLPACEWADGSKFWWVNGQRHRDMGLPAIEYANGVKFWFVNNQQHREGGLPSIEYEDGSKEWHVNDQRHRDGGLPACEYADGEKQWFINGVEVTEEQAKSMSNKCDVSNKIIEINGKKFKLVEV